MAGDDGGQGTSPGYDMATGLGTPKANLLIPDLAAYDLDTQTGAIIQVAVTTQPPSTVVAGSTFGLSAAVEDKFGDVNTGFNGTATLTPVGGTTPVATANVIDGVVVFDGLTLAANQSASYQVAITINNTKYTQSTNVVKASSTTPPSTSATFYPAPSFASLSSALQMAATDQATNITIVLEAGIYALDGTSAASLLIQDTAANVPLKTFTIVGAGEGKTIIEPAQPQGWAASIFEIKGVLGAEVDVTI